MSMQSVVAVCMKAGLPLLIWGPPGVGKSASIVSMAERLGLPIEVVIASIREPSDFSGLPVIYDDEVRLAPPAWARRLIKATRGVVFFDEISTATPAVQAALLRVINERWVGEAKLPPSVAIIAAANPPEQAAGGWNLSWPLANRFVHVDWKVDHLAWVNGMLAGWPVANPNIIPDDWEQTHLKQAEALIASYIQHKPTAWLDLPKSETEGSRAWASPRSWSALARIKAVCDAGHVDGVVFNELAAGCVGQGHASEVLTWMRELDLPDPEEMLEHPDRLVLPTRGDQAFAILNSICAAFLSKPDKKRWANAWKCLVRAYENKNPDIAAHAAKTLVENRKVAQGLYLPTELGRFTPLLQAAGIIGGASR